MSYSVSALRPQNSSNPTWVVWLEFHLSHLLVVVAVNRNTEIDQWPVDVKDIELLLVHFHPLRNLECPNVIPQAWIRKNINNHDWIMMTTVRKLPVVWSNYFTKTNDTNGTKELHVSPIFSTYICGGGWNPVVECQLTWAEIPWFVIWHITLCSSSLKRGFMLSNSFVIIEVQM